MRKLERRKLLLALIATGVLMLAVGRVWMAQSSREFLASKSAGSNSSPTPVPASKTEATANPALENLILLSHSASPEIQADLLLTIASANLIPDKKRRIEILNEAFQAASRVAEPVRKKSWATLVDTRSGFKQRAFDLQLDRLSIESRVISALILLDPKRARELFQRVEPPKIQPLDCKESLIPEFGAYYTMVVAIAANCFTPEEIEAEAQVQFLTDQIEAVRSVPQATAALKALAGAQLSDGQLARVVLSLAKAFAQLPEDPRSFAFSVQHDGLISVAERFLSSLKRRDIPTESLSIKMRDLLLRNMGGEVCADAGWLKQKPALPPEITTINAHFNSPITSDDFDRVKFGGKSVEVEYWTSAKGKLVLQAAKGLRFAADGHRLTPEERATEQWHQKLLNFLDQLDNWSSTTELSEDDYFQQRCNMYRVLVDLCPDDLQRDAVLRAYGSYLKDSNLKYKGRIEWISPVKDYLKIVQAKEHKTMQSSLSPWRTSSDIMLRAYAELSVLLKG